MPCARSIVGTAAMVAACTAAGCLAPPRLPPAATAPPPELPLRGLAPRAPLLPAPLPTPAWPKPAAISFPKAQDVPLPAFDLAQPAGLTIGLFGLGKPTQQEFPELAGLVVAAQTYLLEDGRSLFFQTNAQGNLDIWRLDVRSHQIDRLPWLNTPEDEADFALTVDARWLVFARGPAGKRRLARADLHAALPAVEEVPRLAGVTFPSTSQDGQLVAYGIPHGAQTDVELYDFAHHAVLAPPFLNSPANESFPWLLPDGQAVAFVSDRLGSPDLFLADMHTGMVRTLALANSPAKELAPAYIGGTTLEFVSDRTGPLRMYTYDYVTRRLDTVPY